MPRAAFPEFGARLRRLFAERRIDNQSDFARLHRFSQPQVSRWLRGSIPERKSDRERLARVLGLRSFEDLLVEQPAAPPRRRARAAVALDPDVEAIADDARREFSEVLRHLDKAQRQRVVRHLREQIALLAELIRQREVPVSARALRAALGTVPPFAELPEALQQELTAGIVASMGLAPGVSVVEPSPPVSSRAAAPPRTAPPRAHRRARGR